MRKPDGTLSILAQKLHICNVTTLVVIYVTTRIYLYKKIRKHDFKKYILIFFTQRYLIKVYKLYYIEIYSFDTTFACALFFNKLNITYNNKNLSFSVFKYLALDCSVKTKSTVYKNLFNYCNNL